MRRAVAAELVEIDLAQLAESGAQSAELFKLRDALCKLFGSAQADLAAQRLKPFVGIDAHETVEREGAGLAVRQVIVLGEWVAACVARRSLG